MALRSSDPIFIKEKKSGPSKQCKYKVSDGIDILAGKESKCKFSGRPKFSRGVKTVSAAVRILEDKIFQNGPVRKVKLPGIANEHGISKIKLRKALKKAKSVTKVHNGMRYVCLPSQVQGFPDNLSPSSLSDLSDTVLHVKGVEVDGDIRYRGELICGRQSEVLADPQGQAEGEAESPLNRQSHSSSFVPQRVPAPASRTPKRSTERGEGREKLIAALTKHHRYADGGCLNVEPVGNNELARSAEVAKRTASAFFEKEFQGHARYKALCGDAGRLTAALKLLNGEFAPHLLYGSTPTQRPEREHDADDD
jgi:hypothetical protein